MRLSHPAPHKKPMMHAMCQMRSIQSRAAVTARGQRPQGPLVSKDVGCAQPERMSIGVKRSQILDIAAVSELHVARFNARLSDLAAEKAALSSRLCALGDCVVHTRHAACAVQLLPEVAAILATAGRAQVRPGVHAAPWRPSGYKPSSMSC